MKKIIALAALVAVVAASPAFAASKRSHGAQPQQPLINGYTLQEWNAGAPSPGS